MVGHNREKKEVELIRKKGNDPTLEKKSKCPIVEEKKAKKVPSCQRKKKQVPCCGGKKASASLPREKK